MVDKFCSFCLRIKIYAYICDVFFMVLELRLTKIGCRETINFSFKPTHRI